jgi:hypothetical protein
MSKVTVKPPEYLYHATHLGKLGTIAAHGLRRSVGSQFSGGYTGHSQGRVFFTDFDGLRYWMHKMEMIGEYNSDFKEAEEVGEWAPIALRIPAETIYDDGVNFHEDTAGNRDNPYGEAYYVETEIDADWIEVWDGSDWIEIGEADPDDLIDQAVSAASYEQEERDEDNEGDEDDESDEDRGWWEPDWSLFLPGHA